jgi:F-type H+-transporting ATPase subunit gamma
MKEIRDKVKSVQNTRKITRAMEMVAASKMRRVQERMRAARPYADKMRAIAAHLSHANPEYLHPFMKQHPDAKRSGIILVTTDKGLCGGLNTNILRMVLAQFKALEAQTRTVDATGIGGKGVGFLNRLGAALVSQVTQLGDAPSLESLIGAVKVQLDAYARGELSAVMLAYTRFINTMKQEPVIEQLLPLTDAHLSARDALAEEADVRPAANSERHSGGMMGQGSYRWDYLYEPDPQTVLDGLLPRYVETLIYQAILENMACEQSARMVAMKAASDNAKTVIDDLQLIYNKSRQAAITKELSEIVGGAAAV